MSKRHADETVASEVVPATSHAHLSGGTSNSIYRPQYISQSAHKKLHLLSPKEQDQDESCRSQILNPLDSSSSSSSCGSNSKKSFIDDRSHNGIGLELAEPLGRMSDDIAHAQMDLKSTNTKLSPKQLQAPDIDTSRDNSRHLVKTVLDLPIFVTIEGFRIASYTIDGEPHLCLPQLLQFMQGKFPLDKVIDKFEELVTNFITANPKQVEGFIKAIVLPQDAKTCPLIKRSDAEWICLALYDQHTKGKWGNIVDLCSRGDTASRSEARLKDKKVLKSDDLSVDKGNSLNDNNQLAKTYQNISNQTERDIAVATQQQIPHAHQKGDSRLSTSSNSKTRLKDRSTPESTSPVNSELDKQRLTSRSTSNTAQTGADLFECGAQDTILNLARAVTSTLIIQVYHRCFGKCVGLYYPSLLTNSQSDCIECLSCRKLLSPRRFIGHTHGPKEVNVCHWGFNSYNWRNYIRLSRKQSMNNLDDDELLKQFNLLKSVKEESIEQEIDIDPTICEIKTESTAQVVDKSNQSNQNVDNKSNHVTDYYTNYLKTKTGDIDPAIRPRSRKKADDPGRAGSSRPQNIDSVGLTRYDLSESMKTQYNCNVNRGSTSSSARQTSTTHNQSSPVERVMNPKLCPTSLLYGSMPSSIAGMNSNFQSSQLNGSNVSNIYVTNFLNQLYGDTTLAHLSLAASNAVIPNQMLSEKLIKQDVFVSTSMKSYLATKGLHPKMIEDIVDSTLESIQRARTLF